MDKTFVYSQFAITFDCPRDAHEFVNSFYGYLQRSNLYDRVSIYQLRVGDYQNENDDVWKK